MSTEIWKIIEHHPEYSVSSLGRVKNNKTDYVLSPCKRKQFQEYLVVNLYLNHNGKNYSVHRLVAEAFIPNDDPEHKTQVNHKDENPANNCIDNLEWITPKDNCNYGNRNKKLSTPVAQYSLSGKLLNTYCSTREAERQTGIDSGHISSVCSGNRKTAGGYIWRKV